MLNKLKGWLVELPIGSKKGGRILMLNSAGSVDLNKVYEEMEKEITGVKRETIVHVTTLFLRVVAQLILNGYSVNTGLFRAVARFSGMIEGGVWNPQKNTVYVDFTQEKLLREAIRQTKVEIQSEKPDSMYITEVEDRILGMLASRITPGHNVFVRGARLKVMGVSADIGVSLTHTDGSVVKIVGDNIIINNPSELLLLLPANMKDGVYELKVTTQYCNGGNTMLKQPRSVSCKVQVGDGGGDGGGGDDDRPVIE